MPSDPTTEITTSASLPPHLDLPACPECAMACGTTDDARRGCLRCGACGHEWTATPDEIRKAGRADRAYAIEREAEAELELALARLPTREREINRRMLEAARRRPELSSAAQAELFGGEL